MNSTLNVLAIDNESVVRKSVERVCGSEGIAVETASSAQEGLERLRTQHYGVVLCDLMMDGQDGFEFLAEVERRGIRTPVVITTGSCTDENAIRALRSGAIDVLPTPFTPDELIAAVRRAAGYGGEPQRSGHGSDRF
jgi:DNA-binding NtrC family response regulator